MPSYYYIPAYLLYARIFSNQTSYPVRSNDEYSQVQGELPSYYDYRYTDEDGTVLTLDDMEPGSYYFREVYVKDIRRRCAVAVVPAVKTARKAYLNLVLACVGLAAIPTRTAIP